MFFHPPRIAAPQSEVRRRAFTLVELLAVVVVLAVLAAMVLPKFVRSSERSKESALRVTLREVRNATQRFYHDTGMYPWSLEWLAKESIPDRALKLDGSRLTGISLTGWNGPYLDKVPIDPVSGTDLQYETEMPDVGVVRSSATGNDSGGVPFSSY